MIVVDDGSSDRTVAVPCGTGALVVSHQGNQGKAAALRTGLCEAFGRRTNVVVLLDADGQRDPADIPFLVQPIRRRYSCERRRRWRYAGFLQ